MRGQTIFIFLGGGDKTYGGALHCGRVSDFLPACLVLDACMLVLFFFEKCPSTPWHSGFEKRTKNSSASFVGHNELVPHSFFNAERRETRGAVPP